MKNQPLYGGAMAVVIWTVIVFAIGWGMGDNFGSARIVPDPSDGTRANYVQHHIFSETRYVRMRLMRLPAYQMTARPVWAAQGLDGQWYPLIVEND